MADTIKTTEFPWMVYSYNMSQDVLQFESQHEPKSLAPFPGQPNVNDGTYTAWLINAGNHPIIYYTDFGFPHRLEKSAYAIFEFTASPSAPLRVFSDIIPPEHSVKAATFTWFAFKKP